MEPQNGPPDAARVIFRADFHDFCRFHSSCQTSCGAELLLHRPNATALVTQHALIGYLAFQTLNVIIRVILEQFGAIWTAAEKNFLTLILQHGGRLPWFLSQTGWAHDQIIRFLSIFLGIGDEQVDARLATEGIFFVVLLNAVNLPIKLIII